MVCYHPQKAYKSKTLNASGKRGITFNRNEAYTELTVVIPCGSCHGCRLEKARNWAVRCTHEAQMHEDNSFLTLTYSDEHLPRSRSIDPRATQLFMKKLRHHLAPKKIRFFLCGEYGGKTGRPHYHILLFGHQFDDLVLYAESPKTKDRIYTSETLDELWQLGECKVGKVSFQSAGYVARYQMKKIGGKKAAKHYEYVDELGEVHQRQPEFSRQSNRPGIGKPWLDKFHNDIFPRDFVIHLGKKGASKMAVPKYYDKIMEREHPKAFRRVQHLRKKSFRKNADNNTPDRLAVREEIKLRKTDQLKRNIL